MCEWVQAKLGEVAHISIGGTPSRANNNYWAENAELGLPWVSIADIKDRYITETKESITLLGAKNSNTKPVPQGTPIMSFKLSIGRTAIAGRELYTNEAIAAITPKDHKQLYTQYLYYVLPGAALATVTDSAIKGATLNKAKLGNIEITFPNKVTTQQKIAKILSTIDEAIEHTEALIEKTKKIKAGLMQDLFTRGILPNGQLRPPPEEAPHLYKDSPLGWIPREWEVKTLGSLAEIVSGITLNKQDQGVGIEIPYLRVANVQDGYLDLNEVKTIRATSDQIKKLALQEGDVLMNEGGDFDKLGRGTVWHEQINPCIHQNHVFRVRPRTDKLLSQYLAYWTQSEFGKRYFVLSSKQSTNLASINSSQLHKFRVAVPALSEQKNIETRINALDIQIAIYAQEDGKLAEEKQGLMHDLLSEKKRSQYLNTLGEPHGYA